MTYLACSRRSRRQLSPVTEVWASHLLAGVRPSLSWSPPGPGVAVAGVWRRKGNLTGAEVGVGEPGSPARVTVTPRSASLRVMRVVDCAQQLRGEGPWFQVRDLWHREKGRGPLGGPSRQEDLSLQHQEEHAPRGDVLIST